MHPCRRAHDLAGQLVERIAKISLTAAAPPLGSEPEQLLGRFIDFAEEDIRHWNRQCKSWYQDIAELSTLERRFAREGGRGFEYANGT